VERLRQLLGEIDIYVNGGDLDNENALLQPQAYIGMFAEAVYEIREVLKRYRKGEYVPGTIVAISTVEIQPGAAYLSSGFDEEAVSDRLLNCRISRSWACRNLRRSRGWSADSRW